MRYVPSSSIKHWNNHSQLWLKMITLLLGCMLMVACDASGVNTTNNSGPCSGSNNNCTFPSNSSSGATTGTSFGVPVPSPTPSPTASPTPTPEPRAYKANWSNGLDGWVQSGDDWSSVNNMLVNDGMDYDIGGNPTVIAPGLPQDVSNYSVQTDIRLDKYSDQGGLAGFGVVVRSPDKVGGYKVGLCAGTGIYACDNSGFGYDLRLSDDSFSQGEPVVQAPFHPTNGTWHTYRIDVQGNTITVWLDGTKFFSPTTDDKYLSAGSVGLWSDRCQISVRNFMITAL